MTMANTIPMIERLSCIFFLACLGCGETVKKASSVYFAGEIVNPNDDYVVLYKGNDVVDSVRLDEKRRFSFVLTATENGLYHFKHGREQQYVYLQGGDSLLVRLNTIDFDESLVFSGTGEEINNFLLELFLANEAETSQIKSYYKLEPMDFQKRINHLRKEKHDALKSLEAELRLPKEAVGIVSASIDYAYRTYFERYPFRHGQHSRNAALDNLPPDFYDYRDELDFDNKDLTYLRPYYHFMIAHFGNLAYMACRKDCRTEEGEVIAPLHFNGHKLRLIDSLVKESELKDNLFRNVTFQYLLKDRDNAENHAAFIKQFRRYRANNRHIGEIDKLYQGISNLQPGKPIPDVAVIDYNGNKVSIRDIAKHKRTVFYFWSGLEEGHFKSIVKRVRKLESENPEYYFVGLNLKTTEGDWKTVMARHELAKDHQFRAENWKELTEKLIVYPMNKCIVTKNSVIVDAFADIYRVKLSSALLAERE